MTDDQLPQKTFEIDGDIREELREWAHEPHMDEVYMSRLITAVEEIDALRSQLEQVKTAVGRQGGAGKAHCDYTEGWIDCANFLSDEITRITEPK